MKNSENDFEEIRPYHDSEINAALKRIAESPFFPPVSQFVFPEKSVEEVKAMLNNIMSADEFQVKFMHKAVRQVIAKSSDGLTSEGFDMLDPETPYLFISNHRDIVLDSAILQTLLVELNIPTTEITFGSNLMINPFIIDFGKVNKMFRVQRGGTKLELLKNSIRLSGYIRYTITEKKHSAWIAQRNGRTKDGHDKTEEALLKMLNLSDGKGFIEKFLALKIVPLSISYEYEPCGTLKVDELYKSQQAEYRKSPGEDLNSIISGIMNPKGRIHLCAGKCVNEELNSFDENISPNENISRLTKIIDKQIYHDYKLWKTNYIAYDMLETPVFSAKYSASEKDDFLNFIEKQINTIEGDKKILKEMYLKMYTNPVINYNNIQTD
ncbi:MAG: acyltransferase [Bacteroidota bacterium]